MEDSGPKENAPLAASPKPSQENPANLLVSSDSEEEFAVAIALAAAGGLALKILWGKRKKKELVRKKEPEDDDARGVKSFTAGEQEIVFSKDLSSFLVGKKYSEHHIEPYLAELAEAGLLLTLDREPQPSRKELSVSRERAAVAFHANAVVRCGKEEKKVKDFPKESPCVLEFGSWIREEIFSFQKNY